MQCNYELINLMCAADLSCPADPDRPRAASPRRNAEPDVQYGRPNGCVVIRHFQTLYLELVGAFEPSCASRLPCFY